MRKQILLFHGLAFNERENWKETNMLRNTTAIPTTSQSFTPANTAGGASALEHATVGQASATGSSVKRLSSGTVQAIQKIADDSIQKQERIESLTQSIGVLTTMKAEALKEKALITQHEIAIKQRIKGEIDAITEKEKSVRNDISNVAEQIQSLEKKQERRARLAAEREVEFNKHFGSCKTLLEGKSTLTERKSSLSDKQLALRHGVDEKRRDVNRLESKMKSLDASIKKLLETGVDESYEEMMHTSTALFKKHGKQVISESTIDELTEHLARMTEQPKTKAERIKDVENKHKIIKYAVYTAVLAIAPAIVGGIYKTLQPYQLARDRIGNTVAYSRSEHVRLNQMYKEAAAAYDKKHNEMLGILGVATVLVTIFAVAGRYLQSSLLQKTTDNIRMNESEPTQRTLRSGAINGELGPSKSAEEALFKFAFGLAQHSNLKLIKSPLDTMTKEVTRLVMDAKTNGASTINREAIDKGKIQDYMTRLTGTLGKENERLEKKLDAEVKKLMNDINRSIRTNGKKFPFPEGKFEHLEDFLKSEGGPQWSVAEKASFLKLYFGMQLTTNPADHDAKAVCDMASRAEFIYEFSKVFNGPNEATLADAIGNTIGDMAQEMFQKMSATDASSSTAEPRSFERRIQNVDQEKQSLDQALKKARADLAEIVQDNEKLEGEIRGVEQEIRGNDDAMNRHKQAMTSIPLTKDQLAIYVSELSSAGIAVKPQEQYAGLSAAKARHLKEKEIEEKESLPTLLKTHEALHDRYADLQAERKEKEGQLKRSEFLDQNKTGKDAQIRKIDAEISAHKGEIDSLKKKEAALMNKIDNMQPLREILTPKAIRRVRQRHLAQSETDLKRHADRNGYSSNYKSVGHFLKACLDTHVAFHQKIEDSADPDLQGFFARSDVDVADGMDKSYRNKPIAASVSDFLEVPDQDGKKYLIDHIYGYVPRG